MCVHSLSVYMYVFVHSECPNRWGQLSGMVEPAAGLFGAIAVVVGLKHVHCYVVYCVFVCLCVCTYVCVGYMCIA